MAEDYLAAAKKVPRVGTKSLVSLEGIFQAEQDDLFPQTRGTLMMSENRLYSQ